METDEVSKSLQHTDLMTKFGTSIPAGNWNNLSILDAYVVLMQTCHSVFTVSTLCST